MTTFSPKFIGPVETRRSMSMFFLVNFLKTMRPSCGSRRSAMSRLHMILRRVTSALATFFGRRSFSWQTPSMR